MLCSRGSSPFGFTVKLAHPHSPEERLVGLGLLIKASHVASFAIRRQDGAAFDDLRTCRNLNNMPVEHRVGPPASSATDGLEGAAQAESRCSEVAGGARGVRQQESTWASSGDMTQVADLPEKPACG